MSDPRSSPSLDSRAVRSQLRRILASREFAGSARMSRFLELAVSEALAGRGERLKEYVLGTEVFDRPANFDPGADPIVRVEARRLRSKLGRYYSSDGRHDEILIDLPKGGYAPAFSRRPAAAAASQSETSSRTTIAVLPFANLSAASDTEFFSDGLTLELIHRLTKVENLDVVAWNSAEQLRAESPDIYEAGRKLKVRNILAGSVRQRGDHLRVLVQLIDSATGRYLWSETYDRRVEDILSIQEDIARAIVETLRMRFAPQPAKMTSCTFEAYQLYLRGRVSWNHRTEAGLLQSVEYFRQSTEVEPGFALGYAGVADALTLLAEYGLARSAVVMPQAKSAALRALGIDATLGEAWCSLATIQAVYEWNWSDSEASFRKSLELNPGYATSHHFFGADLLASLGRLDEALYHVEIARKLDPLAPIVSEGYGYIKLVQRRYEEAERHYRMLARTHPGFYKAYTSLGRTLIQMGRYKEALEMFDKGRSLAGDVPTILGAAGQAWGLMGRPDQATRYLRDLESMANLRYVPSSAFALIHAGLGESEKALDWLEKGVEQREMSMKSLGCSPAYDSLRHEARFNAFIYRIGLPPYCGQPPKTA